ncbi:hypothetical protein HDU98_003799 [Podochytrium sp. JEL0797]|nr:hypothetical protein HDU98_003799 [Podochytrium sp. JEL0797]
MFETDQGLTPDTDHLLALFPNDELPEDNNFPRWMPDDGIYGPSIPTSLERVQMALKMADCKPGDHVLDLGCGDGRFCVAALTLFGATSAAGIDCDEGMVLKANELAKGMLLREKISYHHGDIRDEAVQAVVRDLKVSVLVAFLTPEFSCDFKDMLVDAFQRGVRIVAVSFDLANIKELTLSKGSSKDGIWVYQKKC